MKVDTTKLKKSSSELTPECRQLIDQITACQTPAELLQFLDTVHIWVYGKCELYHWIDILDRFDRVLEEAARPLEGNEYVLYCDTHFGPLDTKLLLLVLNFTTLLIEHSFSRHLYNSVEHLTQLLSSENMDIVLAVLNLLYMFSKRSNFIPRLSFEKKEMLLIKLFNTAERWGDPNYGLALIDCCMRKPKLEFLYQLFIEYMDDKGHMTLLEIPDMMDMCAKSSPATVTKAIVDQMVRPSAAVKLRIAHRVRLVSGFKNDKLRLQFVQARLQAVSVLIYSNALNDNTDKVLYPGFGEELCELIDKEDVHLVEIRAAVLRTLTAMLHFDRNPNVPRPASRLPKIIQYTGAERQSGILPLLVRDCINSLTGSGNSEKYPLILATSLFSLLYHLASYEIGGHALVKSGMMQSLLRVISWPGMDLEHITFVTRAVRVIDLITNIDIAKFHQNNGLNVFIDRLEKEVNSCRKVLDEIRTDNNIEDAPGMPNEVEDEAPAEAAGAPAANNQEFLPAGQRRRHSADSDVVILDSPSYSPTSEIASGLPPASPNSQGESSNNATSATNPEESRDADLDGEQIQYPANSYYSRPFNERNAEYNQMLQATAAKRAACVTQRAALLKSMLNFLKKSIQDHSHFNGMRNIMETSLPNSLRHIISNAEYYGPSLFLLATDVVTVYVFNEPSLLSSLQDSGLTSVMLQSLLRKDVPATREVLGSLPNVFSALCLNERGLMEFMSYEPFDKLLKVLLSPDYLVAMRRRRSSDPVGDTATNLGNATDELMKHHPYLRTDATEAIVRLLNELVRLGSDINFVCWRANKDTQPAAQNSTSANAATAAVGVAAGSSTDATAAAETEHDSSGEDDDDDDEMSSASQQQSSTQAQHRQNRATPTSQPARSQTLEREAIPLIDYILNVMKFLEAIFNNSSNGEHCHEFVMHGGLKPLLQLLSLPNLPVDSPVSTTAQAVANVCKSILNLAHETKVIDIALKQLAQIVAKLKPLIRNFSFPGGSVLLCELLSCPRPEDGFSLAEFTPLLHAMSSVHGYVVMLVCLCRNASNEMRSMLLMHWGAKQESGLFLLKHLVQLYISLVWESTILLSLCSEEPFAQNANDWHVDEMCNLLPIIRDMQKDTPAADGEQMTAEQKFERSANAFKAKLKPEDQLRYIKSLLAASSRLGRALAELFGTLVKLSVGTPQSRQRRNNEYAASIAATPSVNATGIARVLSSILVNGFQHENIMPKPAPKLKLTFLICSVGFTGPMLFDDKRNAFHLMLSHFCEENGLKAYFDMFYWALSLDNPPSKFSYEQCLNSANVLEDHEDDERDLPEGTSEFLDAWLQLLEKMVNPRAIIDSPYSIVNVEKFESAFYMVQVHQLALHAIRRIWKRKPLPHYAVSMTETMITILKHLVKFHSVMRLQYNQRMEELANLEKQKEKRAAEDLAEVNKEHLKLLTDMGFVSQKVIDALIITRSLEEATDFLLNIPNNDCSTPKLTTAAASNAMEVDAVPTSNGAAASAQPSTSSSAAEQKTKIDYTKLILISEKTFSEFCKQALERTFCFMESMPEVIVSVGAELIYVLYKRHSLAERHLFVLNLARDLGDLTQEVTRNLPSSILNQMQVEEIVNGPTAIKLFIRLKVSIILLEETYADMRIDYCMELVYEETLASLIKLFKATVEMMEAQVSYSQRIQPRWLQVLLEFIDALDNVCTILQRKANMRAVSSENWKWYDSSTGKWNSYSEANNIIIRNAFNMGERSVNINIGRQRYSVNFNCMKQVSEASGTHRPVLPSLRITEALCNYASGAPHNRSDKIIMRTIRTCLDGKGVVQSDEVLNLDTLVDVVGTKPPTGTVIRSSPGGTGTTGSGSGNAGMPMSLSSMAARLGGETNERVPTPPLPIPAQALAQPQTQAVGTATTTPTTADFGMNTSQSGTENTVDPHVIIYHFDPPTSAAAGSSAGTAQTEDLSHGASKKKEKVKTSGAQKSSGTAGKKAIIILREEHIGLALFDTCEIVAYLTRILNSTLQVDFETKVSVLKLCARLTKDYKNARAFYKHGGITQLLQMTQSCSFMGFPTFAIVIIRHLLEPPPVLQDAIERILSLRTWPTMPMGHRDLIFLLTQVSSAVARHPKIFLAAAKQILRCDYSFSLMESRFLVRSALASNRRSNSGSGVNNSVSTQTINTKNDATTNTDAATSSKSETSQQSAESSKATKSNPNQTKIWGKKVELLTDIETCMCVMKDLLRAIVQPCTHYGGVENQEYSAVYEDMPAKSEVPPPSTLNALTENASNNKKQASTSSAQNSQNAQVPQEKIEACCCSWHIPNTAHWHLKPVLPRTSLLKILADSVRSYQSLIPRIIVEHVYTPDDSILIEKNQSFLSFILDKFLPIVRPNQDSGVSMMSRVLIASLADCYGQNAVQIKVVEEIHAALVRILALPDSSEKHTRLQVVIGLLPTLIENPMLWSKAQIQRNHMYRILLRQGIMTDLTKIAQYKDLSNSNTVNTIYSILRPMEILLRLTVAPGGPLSKRLYFGSGPNAMNSIMNRRFYPRFLTRASGGVAGFSSERGTGSGASSGRETALRDLIRNVFADRQAHAFDLFLNADGLFVDSEETSPNNGTSGDDEQEDNELIQRNFTRSERANLNLDRLWDDLMQNDGLRVVGPNAGNQAGTSNATGSTTDAHRRDRSENDDEASNNDAGAGGGSDGASSTSETAANVTENAASILGDVTSSDSDSESTENEHHDEEDEDDVVVDANDAAGDNQSETDVDEEANAHQYIQVFQRHIYEAESSETASNDADVDGEEEDADMEHRVEAEQQVETQNDSNEDIPGLIPMEDASSVSALASEDAPMLETEVVAQQPSNPSISSAVSEPVAATSEPNSEFNSASTGPTVNTQNTVSAASNNSGSVRTMPSFSWMQPRISTYDNSDTEFRRHLEMHMSFSNERGSNTTRNATLSATGANTQPPVGTPAGITSAANNVNTGNGVGSAANGMRRDQSRRLIFLDQQYCAPMPSYHNPTEEGQMELFNQDALHWWLEESKHLDLESQTDACMYVAHLLVPHLLRELKTSPVAKKPETNTNAAATNAASSQSAANNGNNRRSAIPVLIHSGNGAVAPANGAAAATAETRNAELSTPAADNSPYLRIRFPRSELRSMQRFMPQDLHPMRLNLLSDDDIDAEAEAEAEAENEADVDTEEPVDTSLEGEAESNAGRNLDLSAHDEDDDEDDEEDDEEVFSDGVEEEGLGDDEDDDFDDEVEEEAMGDDERALLNVTFREEPMHPAFDWEQEEEEALVALEREAISNLTVHAPPLFNRPRPASAPAATLAARASTEATENVTAAPSNEPIAEVEEESQAASGQTATASEQVSAAVAQVEPHPVASSIPADNSNESSSNAASNASNETNLSTQASTESQEAIATNMPAAVAVAVGGAVAAAIESTAAAGTEAGAEVIPAAAAAAAVAAVASNIPEMSAEVRAALGDLVVPEGVDPSFLAALPSEMREEVIQEHLRIQRIRQRAQQNAIQVAHDALVEVNPEFLAALPPNIQSEVLMQQRIEQQRQAAQNSNPEDPVDTAAFFQNLPESLRQTILTDMEDSQIASLPPDIAAEAQYLRRDWETRNGARLDSNNSNTLSGYLRFPSSLQNLNEDSRWHTNSVWYDVNGTPTNPPHHHATIVHHHQQHHQMHGKPIALLLMEEDNILLDPDSLATLLLFLFIEDGKMNYARLHRVIRNLCYHVPTREWVINALISIIKRTNESELNGIKRKRAKPQWLNLRVDAAFGYKSNVFIINKIKDTPAGDDELKLGSGVGLKGEYSISVNPQAAQMVVRNCLDLLFALAKNFPRSFVPYNNEMKKTVNAAANSATEMPAGAAGGNVATAAMYAYNLPTADAEMHVNPRMSVRADVSKLDDAPSTSKAAAVRNQSKAKNNSNQVKLPRTLQHYNTNSASFWDVLLNIDHMTTERAKHVHLFPLSSQPKWEWNNKQPDFLPFNESPFAKLLEMLPYKVICRSPQLTDLLIKLLSSLSGDLPEELETAETAQPPNATPSSSVGDVTTTTNTAAAAAAATATPISTGAKSKKEKVEVVVEEKAQLPKRKIYSKNFSQLQLVIEVLTHQCGTTEGLDNVSKLIVNLSQCSPASNAIFLQYLRAATLGLAQEVREAIQCLLDEIRTYNAANRDKAVTPGSSNSSSISSLSVRHGMMQDRFTTENIVISASSNIKPTCELQLPAMKRLLSGSSAQLYFLRTLKIFMLIRELFEAQENLANTAAGQPASTPKPTLSQIICLDDLWHTLSECLVALEDSKDEYAVLVLQPTVEAFFLIHASHKKAPKRRENNSNPYRMDGANLLRRHSNANANANVNAAAAAGANIPPPDALDAFAVPQVPAANRAVPTAAPVAAVAAAPVVENNIMETAGDAANLAAPTTKPAVSSTPAVDLQQQTEDRAKFLAFAEKHRTVLNQILRQSPTHLSDGPFAVLVDHTRILDFDVKRKYFQKELERIDEGVRREENTVGVRRVTVFEDSFRVLYRLAPDDWKNRFYIVFEDEEGQDAGGLLREWYVIISREIFNPMYALFCVSPGDRVTYMINPSSHANPNHLSYFKFVGRVIAKAVHDNKLLECYFTRSFYKHILGKQVKYTDMESQDYEFYKGLDYLMKNDISTLGYELTFSTEVQEFGVTQVRDLIPNGRDILVTEENKFEYVQLVCQLKMSDSIRHQLDAFLEGFYDIIPKHLISIFNEQELELLISGLPDIDIEDLKSNTEYHKYTSKSIQIQWFWRALRSFDQADRAKFLQFVTGTSKVPLQGFGSLEGMNGIQKFQIHRDDRSTDRLPCAHTCFNQLDLPMYKSYEKLRSCLLKAIHECSEGFGFA